MARKKSKLKHIKKSKPLELLFLLISTIIVLPFLYSTKVLDNALSPRLFGLGVTILILVLTKLVKPKTIKPDFSFLSLAIFPIFLVYFLLSVLSMLWAINPSEGLFDITKTFLSLVLLISATEIFINNKNTIQILTKVVLVSAAFAAIVGFYQYIDSIIKNLGVQLFNVLFEIKGLMAHKNQYAISIYLMLPFTLFGIYKFDKWWKHLSIITSVLIFILIVLLQTRSVWIATIIFLFCFAILWLFFIYSKEISNSRKILKNSIIIIGVILIGFVGSIFVFKNTDTVDLMKYKVLSLVDFKSHDNQGRLKVWKSTFDLVNDNLVSGVGAGNWRISIIPYKNYYLGSNYENWQRPHNDFLWVLAEKGILGIILYISIFVLILIYGLKIIFRETEKDKLIFIALMISGVAGYLIIANFTFPIERINHQVYLFIIFAAIISYYYKIPIEHKPVKRQIHVPVYMAVICLTIFSLFYSYKKIVSEINVQSVLNSKMTNDWTNMDAYADKAFSVFTTMDSFTNAIYFHKGFANKQLKKNELALEYYKVAITHSPFLSDLHSNIGNLYFKHCDYENALKSYNEALSIYPHDTNTLLNIAIFHYNREKFVEAYIALLNCDPEWKPSEYKFILQNTLKFINKKTYQ